MVLKYVQIAQLVRRIAYTCDSELDCGECSQLTPEYVDALLSGQDGQERWAHVRQHLSQCTVCSQETVTLRNLVKMDRDGIWPPLGQLLDQAARRDLGA